MTVLVLDLAPERSPEAREALDDRLRNPPGVLKVPPRLLEVPPGVFRIPPGMEMSRSAEALLNRLLPELRLTCSMQQLKLYSVFVPVQAIWS